MAGKTKILRSWAGNPRLGWWWRWGALLVAALASLLGSMGFGLALRMIGRNETTANGDTDGSALPLDTGWAIAIAIGLVVVGIGLNIANQVKNRRHGERLERKRSKGVEAFNQPLREVFSAFEDLLDEPDGPKASQRFHSEMVKAAAKLFPYEGVRVCVYKLESYVDSEVSDDQSSESAERLWLQLNESGGRPDLPRPGFLPDCDYGRSAIECAQGNDPQRFDKRSTDLPVQINNGAQYRSFLRVPIRSRKTSEPTGLLTLDTRELVEFTHEDVAIGWNISRLLALGFERLARAGEDVGPEVEDAINLMGYADMSALQDSLKQEHGKEGDDD